MTRGGRPRPPAIRPSARSAASAWRTVPRETPKLRGELRLGGHRAPRRRARRSGSSRAATRRSRRSATPARPAAARQRRPRRGRAPSRRRVRRVAQQGRDPLDHHDEHDQNDDVGRHRLELEDAELVVDQEADAAAADRAERHRRAEVARRGGRASARSACCARPAAPRAGTPAARLGAGGAQRLDRRHVHLLDGLGVELALDADAVEASARRRRRTARSRRRSGRTAA